MQDGDALSLRTVMSLAVGGAVLEDGDGIDLVQRYNPRTNEWVEMSRMLIARSGSAACVLNGHIYVVGQCNRKSVSRRVPDAPNSFNVPQTQNSFHFAQ